MRKAYTGFIRKSSLLKTRAEKILEMRADHERWQFQYLSHALISDLWQCWCLFCREVLIQSCNGTISTRGSIIQPRNVADNSPLRIAYEVNQYRKGQQANHGRTINFLRQEPTWGDQSVLLRVIPRLGLSNQANLMVGFGLPIYAAKHIQTVRNSSAHINSESVNEVRSLLPLYTGRGFVHPLDIIWWNEAGSGSEAIFFWVDELHTVAYLVTQ